MSEKECDYHEHKRRRLIVRVCSTLLVLIILVLLVFFITWAILQPKKPRFILQDATLLSFNVTGPILLSTNFQVTITARNRNKRVGIYYDHLDVFITYRDQQITYYTSLPGGYQGHKDRTDWSPFVYGTNIPVAPYNGALLRQDQANGAISFVVKVNGRIRWKVGAIITGHYHLHVNCPAYIPFGSGISTTGTFVGPAIKYQLSKRCSVSF